MQDNKPLLRILFDGPPGPEGGRFVECEDASGRFINAGEWKEEGAYWVLHVTESLNAAPDSAWRRAIEKALGLEEDPENHTPEWAHDIVLSIREIGNARK